MDICRANTTLHAVIAAAALALGGCEYRLQPGLASVPSLNRVWTGDDFRHDVIANGDESCPASGRAEDDRLMRRWPPCGSSWPVRSKAKPRLAKPIFAPPEVRVIERPLGPRNAEISKTSRPSE